MPIIKIYNSQRSSIDLKKISALVGRYFAVPISNIKIIFISTFAAEPEGLFIEINARKKSTRTMANMKEFIGKLEEMISDQGYPKAKIRLEFFADKDLFGAN